MGTGRSCARKLKRGGHLRLTDASWQPDGPAEGGVEGHRVHGLGQGTARIGAVSSVGRVRLDGKFFRLDEHKFWMKGVTYGPFEPRPDGAHLPDQHQLEADLRQISGLGANTV